MEVDPQPPPWVTRPDAQNELKVLGYNLPIDFAHGSKTIPQYPHAILGFEATPLILSERDMLGLMANITGKPDWARKIHDSTIVAKWRAEAQEAITDKQFEFCLEELKEYAKQQEQLGFFPVVDTTAAAYASDTIVPADVKESFKAAVSVLEDVPEDHKDWHPGSEDTVLDLVHPSLYPLRYGVSKVLPNGNVTLQDLIERISQGNIIPRPDAIKVKAPEYMQDEVDDAELYSRNFQWLPSEVAFAGSNDVRITSYINNLHPKHVEIYSELEKVIARIIPMWDATLSSTQRVDASLGWDRYEELDPKGCRYDIRPWKKLLSGYLDDAWDESKLPEGHKDDPDFDEDQFWEDYTEARREEGRTEYDKIEPMPFADYMRDKVQPNPVINLRKDFAKEGLQVILKLANIHLTPEKPAYKGGTWHIEGQLNEHIVASAIYYYDTHNITPSALAFREIMNRIQLEAMPGQNEFWWVEDIYNIEQEGSTLQELASVPTPEDRVLTFPNVLQHCVQPFELADKTQPGHRKILALFLVDPNLRIPSTAHVPPQQKEWLKPVVMGTDRIGGLAKELQDMIWDFFSDDVVMDLEDAKAVRLAVMEERSRLDDEVKTTICNAFNFCEH